MDGYYELKSQFYYRPVIRGFSVFVMFVFFFPGYFYWKIFLFYPIFIFFLFCRGGTEIDFKEGFIRHYKHLFGQKIGTWEQLPEIEYIALHKIIEQFMRGANMSASQREVKYKVNLVHDRKTIEVYSSIDHKEAFIVAKDMSKELGLRLYVTDGMDVPRWYEEAGSG